jgi:hypothetical protein
MGSFNLIFACVILSAAVVAGTGKFDPKFSIKPNPLSVSSDLISAGLLATTAYLAPKLW